MEEQDTSDVDDDQLSSADITSQCLGYAEHQLLWNEVSEEESTQVMYMCMYKHILAAAYNSMM